MRHFTDPTYLRTIHDGLLSGTIHKDNASTLPIGLIGIYEEALPPASNVNERKKFLEFFAVWALLKKEVSAAFVVPLLEGWFKKIDHNLEAGELFRKREEEVLAFIAQYSKWFNSPVSGKYMLYHERLKTYLLQKLSEKEIHTLYEKLISKLEQSIEEQKADEAEFYGMQFMSDHLLVSGLMKNKDSQSELVNLAFNDDFLDRQLNLTNLFKWNRTTIRNALQILTLEHQFQFQDNGKLLTELGLNLIRIFNLEQNDSSTIIKLIAQEKTELAIQRIDNFSGESEYDIQRQFVLTTLCIIELVYITPDSTSKKDSINRFLKKLVELEVSLKRSQDLFPYVLYFELACRLDQMGLDYTLLTNKIIDWDYKWIPRFSKFDDASVSVLKKLLASDIVSSNRNSGLSMFSIKLCELQRFDDSLEILEMISEDVEDVELPF